MCAAWTPRGRRFCTTWSLPSTRPCSRGCREARTTTPSQVLHSPNSIVLSGHRGTSVSKLDSFFYFCASPPPPPAGVAVALKQAMTAEFKAYQTQVLANCRALSAALIDHGYKIVTGKSRFPGSTGWKRRWKRRLQLFAVTSLSSAQAAPTTTSSCWTCAAKEPTEAELRRSWKPAPSPAIRTPVQVGGVLGREGGSGSRAIMNYEDFVINRD